MGQFIEETFTKKLQDKKGFIATASGLIAKFPYTKKTSALRVQSRLRSTSKAKRSYS
ncbi:hypothetical protein GCM10023331_26210 [Algivirga pacifica]|uniref:Uncharacterized protein n=1 Tax=Algivirga pacifica TaxID=1162670 RepID=A0ABP9DC94_9BACT